MVGERNMRFKIILATALLASVALYGCSKSEAPQAPAASAPTAPTLSAPAKKAPDFAMNTLRGQRVTLAEQKGKVVLLDFWATWCPPCQASIPHLNALSEKYKDKGLVVIGASFDKDAVDLDAFVRKNKMGYIVAQANEEASKAYNVSSIPRIFVIDREGNIKGDFLGFSEQVGASIESAALAALNK